MDRREGDPRIYIVTFLFLSCIISGGVLLGLYLFLPNPNPLYLQAGMIFVGVPWIFWLLGYLYKCVLRPCADQIPRQKCKSLSDIDPEKGNNQNSISVTIPENSTSAPAKDENSRTEGEKRVQFGNVTVIENTDHTIGEGQKQEHVEEDKENGRVIVRKDEKDDDDDRDENGSDLSMDCERTPLRLSNSNASYRD